MRYPRRAGHISPAGVAAAKPVRTRRCPATAMPPHFTGAEDEPGRLRLRRRTSALGGRAVRGDAAAEPPPSAYQAEVFHGHKQARRGTRPGLVLARCAGAPPARGFPSRSRRERQGHARREAGADRLALADRDGGSVRDRRRASRSSRSTTSRTTRRRRRTRSSPATRRTPRRSRPTSPISSSSRPTRASIVEALGEAARSRCSSQPTASTLADAYAQIAPARQGDRARGSSAGRGRRRDEAADRARSSRRCRSRRRSSPSTTSSSPTYYSATSKTFIGRVYTLLGLKDIADAADKTRLRLPEALGRVHRRREPRPDRPRRHEVLRPDRGEGRSAAGLEHDRGGRRTAACVAVNDDVASRWGPRIVDFVRLVAARLNVVAAAAADRRSRARGRVGEGAPLRAPLSGRAPCSGRSARSSFLARLGARRPARRAGAHRRRRDRALGARRTFRSSHVALAPLRGRRGDPLAAARAARRARRARRRDARARRRRRTRASSATRSSTRTCSASRPAPGSARRSRSPTAAARSDRTTSCRSRRSLGAALGVALAYALGALRRRRAQPGGARARRRDGRARS